MSNEGISTRPQGAAVSPADDSSSPSTSLEVVFNKIAVRVETMANQMDQMLKEKSKAEKVQSEWTEITRILDRTCLILFTIVIVAVAIGTFSFKEF